MARAHSVWLILVNGKPTKAFTVKHEARSWLEANKGWNVYDIWKLPDGKYPLFEQKRMCFKEFMES